LVRIRTEDIRGSYPEHEFLMEHLRSRGRKSGLPQFGPSTTKLRLFWYPRSRYKPSRARDNSSSIRSRRGRLGSYSDESAYSSDDGGSHSNNLSTWMGLTKMESRLYTPGGVLKEISKPTLRKRSQILTPLTKKAAQVKNSKKARRRLVRE
jgi:hypothetical protein